MTPTAQTTATTDPWLPVSAGLTQVVDSLATRRDLIVAMVDSDPRAPGVFNHQRAHITLDASRLLPRGTDPASLNFPDARQLARFPVISGVLAHETSHADHTVERGPLPGVISEWAALLEEPRIETIMARTHPHTRTWMQASVAHILGDVAPSSDLEAARVLVLVGGRLLGGVLDASDDLNLDEVCGEWLTAEQVAVVAEATAVAVELADGDIAGLVQQAERIAAVMPDLAPPPVDTNGGHAAHRPASDSQGGQPGEGSAEDSQGPDHTTRTSTTSAGDRTGSVSGSDGPGDGQAEGSSPTASATDTGKQLARALTQVADDAADDMRAAAGILGPSVNTQARTAAARTRAKTVAIAAQRARRTTHPVSDRAPTSLEQQHVTRLIKRMRRAADRGVDVTRERAQTPPGALVTSELVQRAAQRAMRSTVTATPWERTHRRERPQPKLTVGIAADISPSQDAVVDQVGVVAWMLNRVAQDRGGQVTTVTWHSSVAVLPTNRGGTVPVAETGGESDGLPEALRALDGMLNLAGGRMPRLVVVITDAQLPNGDQVYAEVGRLIASGVRVLWLVDRYKPNSERYVAPPRGVTAAIITDPDRLSEVIGDAVVAALRS